MSDPEESVSSGLSARGSLAAILERSRNSVVERWSRRVLDDPAVPDAHRLSQPTLHDHIPALIDRLIGRLSLAAARADGEQLGPESGSVALGVAHAKQRAAAHYSVPEALRELSHFRVTVLAICREHGLAIEPDEAELFHATIDEIMTASAGELDRASLVLYQRAMAVVAHELRNPLSAIVMCSARLRGGSLELSSKAVDLLVRNAQLMDRLVADLLTVSKLDAGHFAIRPADVDACQMVRDTCDQFRGLAQARSIALGAETPGEAVVVYADRDRIEQALGNLVANALKFTPAQGRVDVTLEASADRCRFRVADTGPGISPQDAAFVFKPFWQAHQTSGLGTGLGLAIARGIVEAHGGSIALDDDAAPGAVFVITLPLGRGER